MFGGISQDAQTLQNIEARRRSILDFVRDDLNDLHGRLGAVERTKMDRHLDAIRSVERSLFPDEGNGCASGRRRPLA